MKKQKIVGPRKIRKNPDRPSGLDYCDRNEFIDNDRKKSQTRKIRENAKEDEDANRVGPWQFPGRPPLLTINYIFVPSC